MSLETKIGELTAQIEKLINVLQNTEMPPTKKRQENTEMPPTKKRQENTEMPKSKIELETIMKMGIKLLDQARQDDLRKIVLSLGLERLGTISEDQYEQAHAMLTEALAE